MSTPKPPTQGADTVSTPFPTAREFSESLGLAVTQEWLDGFDAARELALMRLPVPDVEDQTGAAAAPGKPE